jgi:hypothetical protein
MSANTADALRELCKGAFIVAVGLVLLVTFDRMTPPLTSRPNAKNDLPLNESLSGCQRRSLRQMFEVKTSDKQGAHSYLQLYQHLFASKRVRARNVLEIGIYHGGSILMWHEYFMNAVTWGLDIMRTLPENVVQLMNSSRARIIHRQDAYNSSFVKRTFVDTNTKLDVFIDDGPHSLESMREAIRLYLPVMASDGIFVIEDVQGHSWLRNLQAATPIDDQKYIEMFDMSRVKGRHDDMTFVINREIY